KSSYTDYEPYTGRPISQTDANGNTGTMTYDNYGRPVTQTDPTNQQTSYTYSSDLKTSTVTSHGRTVTQIADTFGRTIETRYPSGEEDTKTDYYFGTLPKTIYKKQNGTWVTKQSFTYDTYLRKLTSNNPNWGTTTYTYDDPNHTITITDPTTRTSTKKTNTLGQTDYTIGVDGLYTRYTYDGFGNATQVQDPRNLLHESTYDNYGRLTTSYHTHNASTTKKTRSETLYYDNGQVHQTTIKDEQGNPFRTYAYTYDIEGRLTQTQLNNTTVETLTYDTGTNAKGALTKAENNDAISQYTYDILGRITQETTTVKALANKTYTIQTGYNNTNGQIASVTFPDTKAITYAYDTNQRINQINYNNNSTPLIQYTYNPNGTISTMTYANGTVTTYTYTKDVLLTDLVVKDRNQNTIYEQHYTYDARGNVNATGHTDYLEGNNGIQRYYAYDIKDQVINVNLATQNTTTATLPLSLPTMPQNPTYTHAYDANGNMLKFETQHNHALPQNNQIFDPNYDRLLEKDYKDGKKLTFTYDPVGNMLTKQRYRADGTDAGAMSYPYNDQDQLTQVQESGSMVMQLGYDHKRQRIYSYTRGAGDSAGPKCYYWDTQGRIIGEYTEQWHGTTVRYIYSGNQTVAMARPKDLSDLSKGEDIYYFINNA
ncbi:MAG: hypothetical protein NT003_00010, partial [Candidatus Magasanikbacteria bacterium]|nr:hypothetical protein [Candidatus Magasanikbacteria bacterium]